MSNNLFSNNYNIIDDECQELFETEQYKLIDHMRKKDKAINNLVAAAELINKNKSYINSLKDCGTILKTDNQDHVIQGNFCHARLCPVCAWKRSLKLFHQISTIAKTISNNENIRFLFITLTQKNCSAEDLNEEIDNIMYAFKKFRQSAMIKKRSKGIIKTLEITYNNKTNTYHPHIHTIIAVPAEYFSKKSDMYIRAPDISWLWSECLNIEYKANTDVKAIKKEEQNKAVAEVCKYAVKLNDIADSNKIEAISQVMAAVHNRRLFTMSGIFRKTAKQLKIQVDDMDNEIQELITDEGNEYQYRIWANGKYNRSKKPY